MYYVYIIKSTKDQSKYVGYSNYSPEKRLIEHNQGMNKYTKTHRPYELIWFCAFLDKNKAENFEKYLKQGSGFAFANKRLI